MKVLTFSRVFPAYHPKAGQPTFFPEAILTQIGIDYVSHDYFLLLLKLNPERTELELQSFQQSLSVDIAPKGHTIRAGNRWKVGDFFSPRVWSGKPYASKQIQFAPPIEVKKVWDIVFVQADEHLTVGEYTYYPNGYEGMIELLSKNDGLTVEDFKAWFKKPFTGQIICWNDEINY